ncbi:MAG: outer membrane protein transport protein [Gammaproteobacteria bacterium]|jgi:long-chain fatty acid transport protein
MAKTLRWLKAAAICSGLMAAASAHGTTGYFTLGYGAKSMGMAGAVVSSPQDTLAASTNPAGMAMIGERLDFGLRFFSPNERHGKLSTSAFGASFDVKDRSRRNLFLIPNGGFNNRINERLWFGMSMYGNGGLNTTYDRNLYDESLAVLGAAQFGIPNPGTPPPALICDPTGTNGPLPPTAAGCGALVPEGTTTGTPDTGTLGVDLAQALFAPTLSMNINNEHAVGVSLLIGVQRFSARGLGNFQCFTDSVANNPANAATCPFGAAVPSDGLTNNGNDWSYGAGVRVGWIGEVHPRVTLGAAVASKVYMSEFDDYDELFAEDGDFDIPANFTLGATFKVTPRLDISFDYQRILYGDVKSISNPGPVPGPAGPGLPPGGDWLGTDDGLGFGWDDINVYHLAASYRYNDNWTFRAGYALNDQPIPDDQVLFNILAPAVIEQHVTLGFTYRPSSNREWNFAYMHAFKEEVDTSQSAFGVPAEIDMYQNSVDLSYSLLF